MKHKIKKLFSKRPFRKQEPDAALEQAIQNIPKITNETVAEHREDVLSGARKFIYPLQHSVQRVVIISAAIFGVLALGFFVFCLLALYKFDTTSTFMYRVTQVIPFPVAKAGSNFVAYENYLFDLRHYIHYYQTQQKVDFNGESGREQLADFRKNALQSVVNDAYTKQLAQTNNISVSDQEVRTQIDLLRSQNRLGSSDAVLEDVLKEFWGWTLDDFKWELKKQLLAQKVVSTLDTETHLRAQDVLTQLHNGADFATLATQYSNDENTKNNGGDYGFPIEQTNRVLPPQVVATLFNIQPGETSGIVETPLGLEILRVREVDGNRVRASHIFFAFKSIDSYIEPLRQQSKPLLFINP
ncbi:MAG: peptidylprolyl isomerase [Candidatus Saccharimonadales bacterium]